MKSKTAASVLAKLKRQAELKRLYLQISALVANADGRVLDSEISAIETGLKNIGLTFQHDDIAVEFKSTSTTISSLDFSILVTDWEKESAISLIALVAISDGDYSINEKKLITEIAGKLGINPERVKGIQEIVIREKANALSSL